MLTIAMMAWGAAFAAWIIFSIIGVRIQKEFGLSESQFGLLIATPILTGSVGRLFLGIISERFGGRHVGTFAMLVSAASAWLLASAKSYGAILLAALGVGFAGAVFITGISFVAGWFPRERHGAAFGLFGVGQIGAAITNFGAPLLVLALGWQDTARLYAGGLAAAAILFWFLTEDDPVSRKRRTARGQGTRLAAQIAPLRHLRVWRFATYYFFCFGAFVALASWLPRYYIGVYGMEIAKAGALTAAFSLSAALFRAFGGWLSDRWGARRVMYLTFIASLVCLFILAYPPTTYIVEGVQGPIQFRIATSWPLFTVITFVLGFFMSLGMAAVFKHIPRYFPENVGSVGGMVGMIGGLGGFFLPIVFGALIQFTNIWTTAFMVLFGLVAVSLTWMHFAILQMNRNIFPELSLQDALPEALPPEYLPKPASLSCDVASGTRTKP